VSENKCWCGQRTAPESDRCDGHNWLERVAFAGDPRDRAGDAAAEAGDDAQASAVSAYLRTTQ
jgi:hypothetical protein